MSEHFESFRKQVSADFELTWRLLRQGEERLDARIDMMQATVRDFQERMEQSLISLGAEIKQGHRQLFGRMRLQEERFQAFFAALDGRQDSQGRDIDDLKSRVDALERRSA